MVSVLQNVKATMAWRKHQLLADFDENESPVPDKFKRRASLSSINTVRMSLRKRVPLKHVELNFRKTPTWESLEARQKCQTLQTIKRTAKNAFGTVSQKIQKSCQSPARSMMTCPDESIGRNCATSSTKKRSTTPRTPCHKKRVTPAASSKGTPRSSKRALLGPTRASDHKEWRGFSSWLGKGAVSLQRSRRAAALKSPYSSPASASRKIEFDCELELVSSGICQLKHISQAFDDAIVQEERFLAVEDRFFFSQQELTFDLVREESLPVFVLKEVPVQAGGVEPHGTDTVIGACTFATCNIKLLLSNGTKLTVCASISEISQAIGRQAKKLHGALDT